MKKTLFFFSLVLVAMLSTGCGNSQSRIKLMEIVSAINKNCPQQFDYTTLISAQIDDDNVVYNYIYDEKLVNFNLLEKKMKTDKRCCGSLVFTDSEKAEMVNLIITAGYGFKTVFKGTETKKETVLHFSNDDIKNIKNNPLSKEEMLAWQIELFNSRLPLQVDEITLLDRVENSDNYVSFVYTINEEMVTIPQMKAVKDQFVPTLRQDLKQQSVSSSSKPILKLMRRLNKGLKYVYVGDKTGKSLTIEFSNNDLREIANDYLED